MKRVWSDVAIKALIERKKKWNGKINDFYITEEITSSFYCQLKKRLHSSKKSNLSKKSAVSIIELKPQRSTSAFLEVITPDGFKIRLSNANEISCLSNILKAIGVSQ